MLRWYLIHTRPTSADLAQLNLGRLGYDVYPVSGHVLCRVGIRGPGGRVRSRAEEHR
jgi:hypothetical protein